MKWTTILLLFATLARAGLPPTTTQGISDSQGQVTFSLSYPNVSVVHSGVTATIYASPAFNTQAAPANQFVSGLTAPSTLTFAQPAFTNISGTLAGSQLPTFTGDVTNVNAAMTVAKIQGVGVGTPTGTTNVVFSNSPTLVSPTVGTQAAGDNTTLAASTAFVQAAVNQLNPAASVKAASTANIAGTYTNAVGGVCIGDTFTTTSLVAFTTDGYSAAVGDRILFKNQTSAFQNGVWTVTTLGNGVLANVFTRALDSDSSSDFNSGQLVPVINGTANAGSIWSQTAAITTCSSDSQTWTKFKGPDANYLLSANNLADVTTRNTSFDNVAPASPVKGDAIVYNGAHWVRLPVGSNNSVLTSDSTQTNGVAWEGTAGGTFNPSVVVTNVNYTAYQTDDELIGTSTVTFTLPDCTTVANAHVWQVTNSAVANLVVVQLTGTNTFPTPLGGGSTWTLSDPGANRAFVCNKGATVYVH